MNPSLISDLTSEGTGKSVRLASLTIYPIHEQIVAGPYGLLPVNRFKLIRKWSNA